MNKSLIKMRIKSLEEQVKVLKAKLEQEEPGEILCFGDMLGMFEGQLDLSLDEIREHEYKVDLDPTK